MLRISEITYSYGEAGAQPLLPVLERVGRVARPGCRALVLRNLDCAPAADAAMILDAAVAAKVPAFRTFDEASTAIAAAQRFARQRASSTTARAVDSPGPSH